MTAYTETLVDSDKHPDTPHNGEVGLLLQGAETSLVLLLERDDLYVDPNWAFKIRGLAEQVAQRARGRG